MHTTDAPLTHTANTEGGPCRLENRLRTPGSGMRLGARRQGYQHPGIDT
jgi:hypothetical protein